MAVSIFFFSPVYLCFVFGREDANMSVWAAFVSTPSHLLFLINANEILSQC